MTKLLIVIPSCVGKEFLKSKKFKTFLNSNFPLASFQFWHTKTHFSVQSIPEMSKKLFKQEKPDAIWFHACPLLQFLFPSGVNDIRTMYTHMKEDGQVFFTSSMRGRLGYEFEEIIKKSDEFHLQTPSNDYQEKWNHFFKLSSSVSDIPIYIKKKNEFIQ